jgi:glutamine synthetase
MKIKLEYVWLDGHEPEPNLRSKIKITNYLPTDIPKWGFDGSSTEQAIGSSSDCYLNPVSIYRSKKEIKDGYETVYVFCEVLDKDDNPHPSNQRAKLGLEDSDFWVGFEQEYFIRNGRNGNILGFDRYYIEDQGVYYCGVGGQMIGRELSEKHLDMCLDYGIKIEGTNAEVALGQWEYQVFAKGKLRVCDDLWISRYFLYKLAEEMGYDIELHPKPLERWNGSGMHTNFSTHEMRHNGGEGYFQTIYDVFERRVKDHIKNYGSDNDKRLTGKYETQSIDKFTWGVGDRGASIRIPKSTGETWLGYLEDRRPASNADPYRVVSVIYESMDIVNKEYALKQILEAKLEI